MAKKTAWIMVVLAISCGSNLVFATCQELVDRMLNPNGQKAVVPESKVFSKAIPEVGTGPLPDLGRLEQLLNSRSKLGEVGQKEVTELLAGVSQLDARLGHSVLGEDVPGCLQNFSPEAMKSFVGLFSALGKVKSEGEVLSHLEGQAKKLFGDTEALAHQRICAFTGINPQLKCKILNSRYAQSCH